MTTIKQVAKLAGVSIATVSRYLNNPEQVRDQTRDKVSAAIATTGYAPNALAQNFRRGKTGVVVVVIPSIGDPFLEQVMRGISQIAKDLHYTILIRETQLNNPDYDEYSNMIFSKQADGIILLASPSPFSATTVPIKTARQLPIILACESVSPDLADLPSVRIDNSTAAAEATGLLIGQGHKKIAFIYGNSNSTLTQDRELGYRYAMSTAKLTVRDEWVIEGGLTLDGARKATRRLLSSGDLPSAIFCANDEMAMGCIHELKQAKLNIPGDISVIGFDDIRYAEITDPPLTTIAQPAEEIGEKTMLRLHRAIETGTIDSSTDTVPHKLVIRNSTGPAPSKH